jgi:hypothetical protein
MFQRHARLILEREYISGYSNARTFLAQPIHPDGRADAYTIIKISDKKQIEKEYKNYQAYVRESLPPVTGRILDRPVTRNTRLAGLRYTFVGEIGSTPRSLKEVFLANADPSVLDNLMKNFGPNWWLQRQPYTFRLGQEYDRKLPAHYTLKRARKTEQELDGNKPPWEQTFSPGQRLQLKNFPRENRHMGRDHWSLRGKAAAGFAPLRVNLPGEEDIPTTPAGEVTHTRVSLLRELTDSFDLGGLPDPIERIPELLAQKVSGTKSIIHGDLNLENVILGPGGLLWLIDFAETRFGHPIFDFVTLAADIIAHVIRTQVAKPSSYLRLYEQDEFPLLSKVRSLAQSCWFDRGNPREYQLALALTCLGAIKHTNLDGVSRHLLYLTAAYEAQNL